MAIATGLRHRRRLQILRGTGPSGDMLPSSWAVVPRAAFPAPSEIRREAGGPSSLVNGAFDVPFDRVVLFRGVDLVAGGLAAGVEFDLVGGLAAQLAGGAIAGAPVSSPTLGPVPAGYRGVLDAICPYVTDLAGAAADITPEQLGLSITWRLRVDGKLSSPYDQITHVVSPWHQLSFRPLLELDQGARVTATVQCVAAPYNQIGQLGIRLRGRWVPWDQRAGRPKTPQAY